MRKSGLFFLLFISSFALFGQKKLELEAEKKRAFEEIKEAKELLDQTSSRRENTVHSLRILQRGIESRRTLMKTLEKEIANLDLEMSMLEDELHRLEGDLQKARDEYARLVYFAYKNQTNYEKLMFILAGTTVSQSYQRYKYLKYLTSYRRKKAAEITQTVDLKNQRLEEMNDLKMKKLQIIDQKSEEEDQLKKQELSKSKMVSVLKQRERELNREIEKKERIARQLERRIKEMIEEEARRSGSTNPFAVLTPDQETLARDFISNKGKLPWPVNRGVITLGYGKQELEGLRGSAIKNNGIDISSAAGTEVRAVFDGEVSKVFAILGANYTVLVRHGSYLTVYQNVVDVRVKSGDKVIAKEILGKAYVDKESGLSQMHFELWKEREILNPQLWLSK